MRHHRLKLWCAAILAVGALATLGSRPARASAADLPDRLWRDVGDVSLLDLTNGAGGQAHAPDAAGPFTFVKEDTEASNPKFDVTDGQGVTWKVKLGEEAQPETAATRFLWAAGYFTDEDYYLPDITVTGLLHLERGEKFLSAGGVVHGARLERKLPGLKKAETWDWYKNPFVGEREMNGLLALMALLNNWDLKAVNNTVYTVDDERQYTVTDMGATFGRSGNAYKRSKGNPADYDESEFIAKEEPESVDFVMHSRPFFLWIVRLANYRMRTKIEKLTRHIPRADAHWLGERLSALSDAQIGDAFRASGYGPADVETFTRTIRRRLSALEAL